MADQKRWFKVWTSLLVDMDHLSDDQIGKWVRLGCRTALVGNGGTVIFETQEHLAQFLKVSVDHLDRCVDSIPGVDVSAPENRHDARAVTFRKWNKYQIDDSAKRQQMSRYKRREEERRGDQKRREGPPTPRPPENGQQPTDQTQPAEAPATPTPPVEPLRVFTGVDGCDSCVRVLNELNGVTARTWTAPGQTGQRVHACHEAHGLAKVLQVVRSQAAALMRSGQMRFLAPQILFKAENFATHLNDEPADDYPDLRRV